MLLKYVLIVVILIGFSCFGHLRMPYSEEWLILMNWGDLSHLFDYQSNHIILTNRLLYYLDYSLSLRGSLVLWISCLCSVLSCYLLESFFLRQSRSLLHQFTLYVTFFCLFQFETYIHPHDVNYTLYTLMMLCFIRYFKTSWAGVSALLVAGFSLLCWFSLVPVFIWDLIKSKIRPNKFQWACIIGFIILGIVYIDAPSKDSVHKGIYFNLINVGEYTLLSLGSFFPVYGFRETYLGCGILVFFATAWVFYKGNHLQRLIILAVMGNAVMIAMGRASPDGGMYNALRSRYYTFLAPMFFVVVDYYLINCRPVLSKILSAILIILMTWSSWKGFEAAFTYKERRQIGLNCLENKTPCNSSYLFDASYAQPDKVDLQAIEWTKSLMPIFEKKTP